MWSPSSGKGAVALVLATWIAISAGLIVFNAALLHSFRHPVLLTCFHQFVSVVLIFIIRLVRPSLVCTGDDEKGVPPLSFLSAVQLAWPVAICQSVGLVCGNMAIMYLSVAFCQMIKAFTVGCVYICGCFFGLHEWSAPIVKCLGFITLGLVLTSWGELNFNLLGFVMQIAALLSEGLRLTLLELRLKSAGYRLNALSSVQVFAPMVCLLLFVCALVFDQSAFDVDQIDAIGKGVFLANASVAFALNVVVYLAIQCASGLTFTLAGVVKDVLIVAGGCYFQSSSISVTQIVGYGIALVGLQAYGQVSKCPADYEDGILVGIARKFFAGGTDQANVESSGGGSNGTCEELLAAARKADSGTDLDASTASSGGETGAHAGYEDDLEMTSEGTKRSSSGQYA